MGSPQELIYDWNHHYSDAPPPAIRRVELDDETLRDGLQSPSILDPAIEDKLKILHYMEQLEIDACDIGLPGAGPRAREDITRLCREIVDHKLNITANCAVRTTRSDITPLIEISQQVGIPIEACTFIGSSPIRQFAEEWVVVALREEPECNSTDFFAAGVKVHETSHGSAE